MPEITIIRRDWELDVDMTCWGCPSAWSGTLEFLGRTKEVYIRVRYGGISIEVGRQTIFEKNLEGIDGVCSWNDIDLLVEDAIDRWVRERLPLR